MLVFQKIGRGTPMGLLHIIKYTQKMPHYYVKATYPEIPDRSASHIQFAAIIRKQIVIGVDHPDCYRLGYEKLRYYSFEEYEWTRMYPSQPGKTYVGAGGDSSRALEVIWSQISESDIIKLHMNELKENSFVEILHFNEKEEDGRLTYSSRYSTLPEEISNLRYFSIVRLLESEILIAGGEREYGVINGVRHTEHHHLVPNENVWSGILNEDNTAVSWKDTGHKIPFGRIGATGFCIDDNIYLTYFARHIKSWQNITWHNALEANKTCIRYDWKTKSYYANVFSLCPEWNVYPGMCGNIVKVNENEKLVLISVHQGNSVKTRTILAFTENTGFCKIRPFDREPQNIEYRERKCTKNFGQEHNNILLLLSYF